MNFKNLNYYKEIYLKNLSVSKKIGLIVIFSISLVSAILILYNVLSFKNAVTKEFAERITSLGENLANVIAGPLSVIVGFGEEEFTPEMLATLEVPLDAIVDRKDIIYVGLFRNNVLLVQANRFGDLGFVIPESKSTGKSFGIYSLRKTEIQEYTVCEIRIPVAREKQLLGEIAFGFNTLSINRTIGKTILFSIVFGFVAIIGLSILTIIFFNRVIVNPFKSLTTTAIKIGEGDLRQKQIVVKSKDEMGQLGDAFNNMLRNLNDLAERADLIAKDDLTVTIKIRSENDVLANAFTKMVQNLSNVVVRIRDSANAVTNSSNSLSEVSEQSTQTIAQLADTILQISEAASQVAKNSQVAASLAQQSNNSAKKGKDSMEKLITKMNTIKSLVETSANAMKELTKRSAQIGEIVQVITKIADKTTLLSFNAAIEAASAGESGKGFAIVAEEVRKLAESSSSSAERIVQIISEVQEDTARAEKISEEGKNEVNEGAILMAEAEEQFIEITLNVENVAKEMEQIATFAEETAASAEESTASSSEQRAAIEKIASSAAQLLNTARNLQSLVAKFKV